MTKTKKIILGSVIGLIIFIALIPDVPKTSEQAIEDAKPAAWELSKELIKIKLTSPSTAAFPKYANETVETKPDSTFYIKSYVDAQNKLGATIRTKYYSELKYKGGDPDSSKNWTEIITTITD